MNAEPNDHPTPPPEPVKPHPRRVFLVRVPRPDGPPFVSNPARAESPEAAAEEVLLGLFGATRPALAPERVEVAEVAEGGGLPWPIGPAVALAVDEWAEARVFMAPAPAAPSDLLRLRAERAAAHLGRARAALLALADACPDLGSAHYAREAASEAEASAAWASSVADTIARRGRP